jgi:alpha-beta hydrolase superfamily lysophospholipase
VLNLRLTSLSCLLSKFKFSAPTPLYLRLSSLICSFFVIRSAKAEKLDMSMEAKARKEDMSIQAKVAKEPAMSVQAKAEAAESEDDMSVGAKAAKIAKVQSMPVE